MKNSWLRFILPVAIFILLGSISIKAQENIVWLANYTSDMVVGSYTYNYSFKTVDNNPCKISIEEKKTDKKGASSSISYQFYLSDLNTSAMSFKTSGSAVVVTMEIKQSQKFISVSKNSVLDGYSASVELNMSEVDKARSFLDAMKSNVESCKSSDRKFTSCAEALKWMAENINKSETSGTTYNQTFKPGVKNYLASIETNATDAKGIQQKMVYDFNLNDINPTKINLVVSGKTFKIEVPTRENNNYIRSRKGEESFAYVKSFDVYSDDIEQARNILNGMFYLATETPAAERKPFATYVEALKFVQLNCIDASTGASAPTQTLTYDVSPSGIVGFATQKTDSKGVMVKNNKTFYLSDFQPKATLDVSSKIITLNLTIKDKNKFIKESSENSILPYTNTFEIYTSDLEIARELANAFENAIAKSEKGVQEFSSVDKAGSWLASNVNEVKIDADKINQSLKITSENENKIDFQAISTNASGVTVMELFEFYPEDLRPEEILIKVSGKKLAVLVSTGKLKYIKTYKDNVQQNYTSDTEVLFDDVQKAKNFIAAILVLREKSLVADRSMKDRASAIAYIMEHVKKLEIAGEIFDQKLETRENDNCKAKLIRVETNSKGASSENVFEFAVSDIDPVGSEITTSSKNLKVSLITKGKQKLIKPYKNGEAGSFIANAEIETDDVVVAKKLLAAFASLSGLCK